MDLLQWALGLIPCDRLWPQTASELVMFATVVVLRLLLLATLAEAMNRRFDTIGHDMADLRERITRVEEAVKTRETPNQSAA